MKTLTLLTFLLFTGIQCFAQQDDDRSLFQKKAEKYRKMKNTGIVLTFGGSVLSIVGAVTLLNSAPSSTYYYGSTQTTNTGNAAGGAIAYLLGAACVGTGVPLWIVGGINHGKYTRKLEALSARLNVAPQGKGVKVTLRF